MNAEDTARCQQAIELANAGQKQTAYAQFCVLYNRGNADDTTLLSWIAYTTPSVEEAQRAIETIAHLEPNHPRLQFLRNAVRKRLQRSGSTSVGRVGPTLQCPYCHHVGPVRIAQKVSAAGWIWLACWLLLFLGSWFIILIKSYTPVLTIQLAEAQQEMNNVACLSFFFLAVSVAGFFIRKRSYTCASCGITLGDITS